MKKLSAKFLCVVLSLVVLLCALPVTVYAEGTTVIEVGSAEALVAACDTINTNGGTYTINLTGDIENAQIKVTKPDAVVTVIGNNHTIAATQTAAVYVENGATVNLGDGKTELILSGKKEGFTHTANDEPGLIYILPGSTCNMNDKVTLTDRKGNNYFGGGVTVKGGTFHMYGGTIQNCGIDDGSVCYGGGVAIIAGGKFIMDSGIITKCYAYSNYNDEYDTKHCYAGMGGGVFVTAGSSFTMNGGTINECEATFMGGGVAMVFSESMSAEDEWDIYGIGNPKSNVIIKNATISNNKAKMGAGVFASGYYCAYSGSFEWNPTGTGLAENPGLYISDSVIEKNEANDVGGGVLAAGIKVPASVVIKNTEISDNKANSGAGIGVNKYWTKAVIDDCHIHDNTASALGGGIYLEDNKDLEACTTVKNTVVKENTAGEKGGGVYYSKGSVLNIEGSDSIQNNTVDKKDNNLYFQGSGFPVNVTGSLEGAKIGITDAKLFEDNIDDVAPEAQSSDFLTEGFKAQNPSLIPENAFTSDHESWCVDFGDKKTEIYKTYKYSAKKYLSDPELTEGAQIKQNGKDYYIEFDADELLGEKLIIDAGTIYDVIYDRFVNNYGMPQKKDMYYKGNVYKDYIDMFHDTRSGYYIGLIYANDYNVFIQVGTDPSVIQNYYNYDISFIQCAGNVQNLNGGKPGKLVMKLYVFDPEHDPYLHDYSSSYTVVEMEYDEPISSDKTEYFANDIGVVSAKVDVDKSTETEISHETVDYDFTNEVRLVRKKPNYHINNDEIDDKYNNNDIFTSYVETAIGKEIKVGETIGSFYTIPEVKATESSSCPYIFKGWYYDPENDNDTHPVKFGTDKYAKDIYAHWIKVEGVAKDDADENELPQGYTQYGGFDLAGIQISEGIRDTNFGEHKKPGGLRFITSLNMDVVNQINSIKPDNIEYGYVAATHTGWINYHKGAGNKLQYVSKTANGIDTSDTAAKEKDYFDFASNINCTSKRCSSSGVVKDDHRNFDGYLLYTLVITYEGAGDAMRGTMVLARPYIHYTDANGLERVAYSEYRGNSNTIGGCYISYNDMH